MSDEPQVAGEPPAAGARTGLVILLRIAVMFVIVPVMIMIAAKYLF
jgi:hypothetical protein